MTKKDRNRLAPVVYGAWIVPLFMWFAEQFLSSQDWWPELPWGNLTVGFVVFSLGFLMRDQWTHHPWISVLFKSSRAGFTVDAAFVDFVQTDTDWFVPTVHIKFWQDTEVGHITVRIFNSAGDSFVTHEVKDAPHRKGDVVRIPLCWLRNPSSGNAPLHSIWGSIPGTDSLKFSDRSVVSGETYWIKISYEWGDSKYSSDTFYLQYRQRPVGAGNGIEVTFGTVESFVPEYLD